MNMYRNLRALFMTSIILGSVACGSSILLLWACLDSWSPDSLFSKWGLPSLEYGKIITAIYLKVGMLSRGAGLVCVGG